VSHSRISVPGLRVASILLGRVLLLAFLTITLLSACGNPSVSNASNTPNPSNTPLLFPPLPAGTPTNSPHQPLATATQGKHPNFRGIYQFKGGDDPANASNPYLAGANITFYWSQLEPTKGQYNWTLLDQAMKPWIDNGKKIILRISTSGWAHWTPPYSGHGTPQWVYDAGVPSVTEIDGAVFPQYWHPYYLQSLTDFVHALARRYDGNDNIVYVQIGVGVGGETKVDTEGSANPDLLQLWQNIGYTDQVWWNTVQDIITIYKSSFHITPLAVMPDATFIGKTPGYRESLVLNYAVQHGIWLQDNGLVTNRTLPSVWMSVPHAAEQLAPTNKTGDTLQSELARALSLGASYILVFTTDINNPANRATLQWASAHITS